MNPEPTPEQHKKFEWVLAGFGLLIPTVIGIVLAVAWLWSLFS